MPAPSPDCDSPRQPTPAPHGTADRRLIDCVAGVVAHGGFPALTVERLIVAAGVSRASFYQYFSSAEDCLWSAYESHAEELHRAIAELTPACDRELGVLEALAIFTVARPQVARLLIAECLAAGAPGLVHRDALIVRIEAVMPGPDATAPVIDVPASVLIGTTLRFLSMRLSDGSSLDGLSDEIRQWAATFRSDSGRREWSSRLAPQRAGSVTGKSAVGLPRRPVGTPRERILWATAWNIRAHSYRNINVDHIVAVAGVSRRSFYNEFATKASAFMAAYEFCFQECLARCAPAFFSGGSWPERVWHGADAFSGFIASHPLFAYLGLIECYAVGPGFTPRVHDTQLAFTMFLEDGYRQRPEASSLSRACSALTAAAIFETAFQASRDDASMMSLRRFQPFAVYLALTPFIGREQAGEFVTARVSALGSSTGAAA